MIQKIQAYEVVGRGTASQVKVQVQSRFTTQDRAIIYYDLRDPNQTMDIFGISTGEVRTLPYRILSYQKIIVTGEDLAAVVGDEKQAVEILKRKRSDITLISGIKLALTDGEPNNACMLYRDDIVQNLYLDTEDLESATRLSETEDMKSPVEGQYYVSDGKIIRFWNGKILDSKFLEACKEK
jgi:hypothetical protein